MQTSVKIATAQYDIGKFDHWSQYEAKIGHWIDEAVAQNAKLLVFPEYFSMELASLYPESVYRSLSGQLEALQDLLPDFLALFIKAAKTHEITIVAGTYPVRMEGGNYRNRAHLIHADGRLEHQDKVLMTRFENEQWFINAGDHLKTFETDFGRIGINVCYDSEFPLLARQQAEAGANIIIVPSCTDTLAGYWRVRIGCQARALENQCYVIQSPTVGLAPWSEAVDVNIGAAAVYTPVDYGYPDDGVLAIGKLNQAMWVFAEIDPQSVSHVRKTGQVFNYRDWPLHLRPLSQG